MVFFIKNKSDKSLKILESKWIGKYDKKKNIIDYCSEVKKKEYPIEKGWKAQHYYMFSIPYTENRKQEMKRENVIILTLEDLFDKVK